MRLPRWTRWILGISANTWIAFGSLVVSVSAIYIAIDQAQQTRIHNRLSVEPNLQVSFSYNKEGSGWDVLNNGFGPARVTWFEVLVDSKPQKDWFSMIRALGLKGGLKGNLDFHVPYKGVVIPATTAPKTAGKLFFISAGDLEKEIRKHAHRVTLRLCYCSFYDDCWLSDTDASLHIKTDCHSYKDRQFVAPPRLHSYPDSRVGE